MIQDRDLEPEIKKNSIINSKIGVIAAHYLPKLSDKQFGMFHNHKRNMHMIGKSEILIKGNDIDLNGQIFKGTQGLWSLLTYNRNIDTTLYTDLDIKNYEKILIETESLYREIEYLISFIASLPKNVIIRSGLVNDFLNSKFMPEIHQPGYNYLGPFTKSKKPINKLNEAAMHHYFFTEKHKDTKYRHKADLILENIAKYIYQNSERSLGEKTAAFATSNIMNIKRKLGMGFI